MGVELGIKAVDTQGLAGEINRAASVAENEEELKIEIVKLLDPIIKKWNLPSPKYERRTIISGARKDALYGQLRANPTGLTWTELKGKLQLPQKVPNNKWVRRMEKDIDLVRLKDVRGLVWKIGQ